MRTCGHILVIHPVVERQDFWTQRCQSEALVGVHEGVPAVDNAGLALRSFLFFSLK